MTVSTGVQRLLAELGSASTSVDDASAAVESGSWALAGVEMLAAAAVLRELLAELAVVQDVGDPSMFLRAVRSVSEAERSG